MYAYSYKEFSHVNVLLMSVKAVWPNKRVSNDQATFSANSRKSIFFGGGVIFGREGCYIWRGTVL